MGHISGVGQHGYWSWSDAESLRSRLRTCLKQLAQCHENCQVLTRAVDALIEERDQYDADLEECRKALAAAEAAIQQVEWFNTHGMAQCPWCRAVAPYKHTDDCITRDATPALEAALAQAEEKGYRRGLEAQITEIAWAHNNNIYQS